MYQISDQQIDYILNDIGARGVEMDSLQQNLVDHVCCIIENNLEENGDFESFYKKTIRTFFKDELWEIEEETLLLLTYKNYYAMKKIMIMSGITAAATFITGSIFKIMHWPGANALIIMGMITSSLIFLPIFFLFKKNETVENKNKLILAIGTLDGILFCVASLLKIMHWPGAHGLWILTLGLMVLVFIPLFFFNGIKNPATKTNTIATTIILIIVAGFFFALTSLRPSKQVTISKMYACIQNEELIKRQKLQSQDSSIKNSELKKVIDDIQNSCNKIKRTIIKTSIQTDEIPADFEAKNIWVEEVGLGAEFIPGNEGYKLIKELKIQIERYNSIINNTEKSIPLSNTITKIDDPNMNQYSNYNLLNHLTQIQLFVLQN